MSLTVHDNRTGKSSSISVEDWSFARLKKPVLCVTIENRAYKIASFNNEKCAELFKNFLQDNFDSGLADAICNLQEIER